MNSEPRTISLSTGNCCSAIEEYLHRLNLIAKDEKVATFWTATNGEGYAKIQKDKDEEVKLSDKKEKSDA